MDCKVDLQQRLVGLDYTWSSLRAEKELSDEVSKQPSNGAYALHKYKDKVYQKTKEEAYWLRISSRSSVAGSPLRGQILALQLHGCIVHIQTSSKCAKALNLTCKFQLCHILVGICVQTANCQSNCPIYKPLTPPSWKLRSQ